MNEPFVPYKLEEERNKETRVKFTIGLNKEQLKLLKECQKVLNQPKVATALKQLFILGANDLLDKKMKQKIDFILGNQRRNKRLGIVDFD